MSILFEKDNCVVLSHENYLNNVYSDVNGSSFTVNHDLFCINKPFKLESKNKKRTHDDARVAPGLYLQKDIAFVEEKYKHFKDQIQKIFKQNTISEDNNQTAIETATILYESSTIIENSNFSGANDASSCTMRNFNGKDFLFPPNCKFYNKDLNKLNELPQSQQLQLINEKYDVILMDPPWWNKAVRRKNWKANTGAQGYQMMYNEDIMKLPIKNWLRPNGVVLIWCTNAPSHMTAIDAFLTAWGLTHCGKWYWLKVTKSGEPIMPFSTFPRKQPFEQIVIASGNAKMWEEHRNKLIVSVPSALHSHKPPLTEVVKLNELIGEDLKCLELFARNLLPGWTSAGLEVLKLQETCYYKISHQI